MKCKQQGCKIKNAVFAFAKTDKMRFHATLSDQRVLFLYSSNIRAMALRFDGLSKQVIFNDVESCTTESTRYMPKSQFNSNKPALSIITLTTEAELKTHLFPRIEEFHKKRTTKRNCVSKDNIFKDASEAFINKKLPIYQSLDKKATYNTIDYIFKEFKRGVFVQILNNRIMTFVALHNLENTGFKVADHIKYDPAKYKNIDEFVGFANKKLYRRFQVMKRKEDAIYFTNCAVNLWESKTSENEVVTDWIYVHQYHMILELLKNRRVNDIEFMLNFKDQTVLVKDGEMSPHFHILGNLTTPMNRKCRNYIPILNDGGHRKFADIAIPTNDDWEIITNKIFLGTCRSSYVNVLDRLSYNYDTKIPTAIFRGGATGCGTVIKNNPRLKAAYLSKIYYNHPIYGKDNPSGVYLDAKLISFKVRPKKHYSEKYINIIDPSKLPIRLTRPIPIGEISNYKYIVSIEGNISQFRLSLELSFNSVILLVKSDYYIWFQPMLKPWVHYVPVKADLSDLMDRIRWCRNNDDKCKVIAGNAKAFYSKYINRNGVYDYLECILNQHTC